MSGRKPTGRLTYQGMRGPKECEISRPINYQFDWRDCPNNAGKAWLIVGMNAHLSAPDLVRLLRCGGIVRPDSWVKKIKWMFQAPRAVNSPGVTPNADGQDQRAVKIMAEHPHLSARDMARLLAERGIRRGRDWVLKHRCDALTDIRP